MENSLRDAGENRVNALEKKVDGVGMLVGKFTEELLDLKAMTREMSLQNKEHHLKDPGSSQEAGACVRDAAEGTALPLQEGSTVASAGEPEDTAPDKPLMVMIMQTDGTMKPEPRRGNKYCISAPVGYGVSGGSDKTRKGIRIIPGQSRLA